MSKKPFSLNEFMPYRFAVIADEMSRALAKEYAEKYGITIPEWRVLSCLLDGEVTAKHVTDVTPMDKVKVSRAVASLEERLLISKSTDPSDGRAALLKLTKKGRDVAEAIQAVALRFERDLFSNWRDDEVTQLKKLLDKVQSQPIA